LRINKFKRLAISEAGAVLVEFALVSLVLIVLLAGIIQVGLIINTKLSLENITHVGARYAASPLNANNDSATKSFMISEAVLPLTANDITITPTTRLAGESLHLTVTYVYNVPVTLGIFPDTITLTANATMMQN
jgi:Flp pilus assembly protein TadG